MGVSLLVSIYCTFTFLASCKSLATDILAPNQTLADGQTLVSSNQKFALGFFSPGSSSKRFLGIWYHNIPLTVVWVANKNNPIYGSSGRLTIYSNGALFLYNSSVPVVWSTNGTVASRSPVLQLLGSGNLVVREQETTGSDYTWQSFDHLSDTLLPGMKLGWKLKSHANRYMTSWKTSKDPSDGEFTFSLDPPDAPQLFLRRRTKKEFRQYPFAGHKLSDAKTNVFFKPILVSNFEEVYYSYELLDDSILSHLVVRRRGSIQFLIFQNQSRQWRVMRTINEDYCDQYGTCGPYGNCFSNGPNCRCLKGFLPRSQEDWRLSDWSGGCQRRYELNCSSMEGFMKYDALKLPDNAVVRANYNLEDCRVECMKECDCMAYAASSVNNNGSQCMVWLGALFDLRNMPNGGEDLYIRMSHLEQDLVSSKRRHIKLVVAIIISTASVLLLSMTLGWFICRLKRRREVDQKQSTPAQESNLCGNQQEKSQEEVLEFSFFNLTTISAATDQFAIHNKIGEGGFGPVYKGQLQSGLEIAVKRLSHNSGQGLTEFTNEVTLIAKLQHRNLVRLLGCCIHEEERMLIYEYLPNKSLDNFIFDQTKRKLLQWECRFEIILGIARGLLYLHQDSRLTIVHRDLKTSNILLDNEMNPKISDFGIARLISGIEAANEHSKRIMGTLGYMSPEYAMTGEFSIKSDIFSLGIILLELISGRKNWGFHHSEHDYNLLGHTWKLWNEGKSLEVVDEVLEGLYSVKDVMRCIQVALLCAQQQAEERPKMCSVVFMLMNENAELPQPKEPGFWSDTSCLMNFLSSCTGQDSSTANEITFTTMEGR